ncbi:MAG: putative sulfate exporter family transporter, partial [Desulfocurvibacter africanus]
MADSRTVAPPNDDVVIDKATSSWSDLWKKEDYWAIWIAFGLLALGCLIFLNNKPEGLNEKIAQANAVMEAEAARAPFKTLEYYAAQDIKGGLKGTNEPIAKTISKYTAKPKGWSSNPLDGLFLSQEAADAKSAKAKPAYEQAKAATVAAKADAQMAQQAAVATNFQDESLNQGAKEKISAWRKAKAKESSAKSKASVKSYNVLYTLPLLMVFIGLVFTLGIKLMGKDAAGFLKGFVFVFAIAALSYLLANQSTMKQYGVEYAVWAIAIGMLISNTVGTPKWVKPALETEFYIKAGLVLLGAGVLFNKIVAIGIPGIFVAWVVTPIVLIGTYIFGQKVLKMPSKTLNMVISADMSVCGTSAAIATAAACRAKKEELTLSIGLSLVFTAIMMVALPAVIKATGMPFILGGAWMGGTIDATGAVAAAGAFLSQEALYVAATIKMIQNVMIGVTAFGVAVYWCYKVDCVPGQKVSAWEIWH